MSEAIAALIGAVAAYLFGWYRDIEDRREQRKAIAIALISEIRGHLDVLEPFADKGSVASTLRALSTPMLDRLPDYIRFFDGPMIATVLQYQAALKALIAAAAAREASFRERNLPATGVEVFLQPEASRAIEASLKARAALALAHGLSLPDVRRLFRGTTAQAESPTPDQTEPV